MNIPIDDETGTRHSPKWQRFHTSNRNRANRPLISSELSKYVRKAPHLPASSNVLSKTSRKGSSTITIQALQKIEYQFGPSLPRKNSRASTSFSPNGFGATSTAYTFARYDGRSTREKAEYALIQQVSSRHTNQRLQIRSYQHQETTNRMNVQIQAIHRRFYDT